MFQVATAAELLAGGFQGVTTYGEIRRHGDFGVGTFDQLDGEMVAVDGDFLQLHSDGSATRVDDEQRAPFAMVTFFRGDLAIQISDPLDHAGLLSLLSDWLPDPSEFCAIKVAGDFDHLVTRTVARQTPPYRPLAEAASEQVERQFRDIAGALIGFRAPAAVDGITLGGYHFHFISDDRRHGGHVLDLRIRSGRVAADLETELHVELPSRDERE